MSLYIDYRPGKLEEVYGNGGVVGPLSSLLKRKRADIPHTFLFHGPTGCGKTTLGRIVASMLGCSGLDLVEINSSNNRGIDTAREIIELMNTLPMQGKCRVFIIDEVHMATKEFQNALLKPLEDTPSHVYFILCTTEPEKLIVALKNRCQIFRVEPLAEEENIALIEGIAEAEGCELGEGVAEEIAEASEGSPRQALIILEKIMKLPPSEQQVAAQLESPSSAQIIELCRAIVKRSNWKVIAPILKGINDDPEKVRRAVLGYFNTVLLGSNGGQADFAALVIELFAKGTFMYSGKAGLTNACYLTTIGG